MLRPQNGNHIKKSLCENIKHNFDLISDMKRSSQFMQENVFLRSDDVIHDVTGWPQSRPSIFFKNEKRTFFRDNWKTNKDMIIKLNVHMYHGILHMSIWISMDYVIHDVIRHQSMSKNSIAITMSVFKLQHHSKALNVINIHDYLSSIPNFRYLFR